MKSAANCISIARMILSLTMVWVRPLSMAFYAIYLVCVMSDVLDGYVARKTRTESKLGAKLDSVADLVLFAVMLMILYPIIDPAIQFMGWLIAIGVIRVVSMMVVLVKYKTFAILHTVGNKVTGIVLSVLPFLLAFVHLEVLMYIICVVASISAVEELFIHLSSKEFRPDKRSLFER